MHRQNNLAAEYYSAGFAEKVMRGMKENALKGLRNGGNTLFGDVINAERKLDIDPKAAPIVAEIFKMSNDGKTVKERFNIMSERNVIFFQKLDALGEFRRRIKFNISK